MFQWAVGAIQRELESVHERLERSGMLQAVFSHAYFFLILLAILLPSHATAAKMLPTVSPTVHGFRSTFRDWAAERTNYQNHIVEMALAHVIGDKVEAAYRRGDLFAKRARLMQDRAKFATTPGKAGSEVISLRRKQSS